VKVTMMATTAINANAMKDHNCCYNNCPEEGVVHVGINGGDSHWICCLHLDHWNADRARFLADGGGCEMRKLGELRQTNLLASSGDAVEQPRPIQL